MSNKTRPARRRRAGAKRTPQRTPRRAAKPRPHLGRKETMTGRERMLAVFRGEEVDRLPVWLKMTNSTWQNSQPEPYRSMPAQELLEAAGCDLVLGCSAPVRRQTPHARERTEVGDHTRITVVTTPDGELVGEERRDPRTLSWHPSRYMVGTPEQLRRLRWLFKDAHFSVDRAKAREAREAQDRLAAQGAVTTQGLGPSPLMSLVEHYCGPENTFCLLADEADLFGETIALMHRRQLALLDALLPHCVADTLWMIENTSSNLISPRLFELFVMPQLREYANRMLQRGVIPVHHMCGRLKALLDRIETLPALVNEAYTTPPLGDVTLADGRRHMPSKTLMGGTNATLWLEGVEKIVETVAADLAACPDRRRIFLTSAGVLPPLVPFDKARRVVERFKRL